MFIADTEILRDINDLRNNEKTDFSESIEKLKEATIEEIMEVKGISRELAKKIKEELKG